MPGGRSPRVWGNAKSKPAARSHGVRFSTAALAKNSDASPSSPRLALTRSDRTSPKRRACFAPALMPCAWIGLKVQSASPITRNPSGKGRQPLVVALHARVEAMMGDAGQLLRALDDLEGEIRVKLSGEGGIAIPIGRRIVAEAADQA